MLLTCPRCSRSFDASEPLQLGESELSCPQCHGSLKVVTAVKIEAMREVRSSPVSSSEKAILVAVEGSATKEMIQEVLMEKGYETIIASTGEEVMSAFERARPSVALLDVGLSGIMGFELCERIKRNVRFRETKIILVASIYDKTRYKREPESLYGADDYIERHHIQDGLISKIEALLDQHAAAPRKEPVLRPTPTASKPVSPAGRTAAELPGMDDMLLEEATIYEPTLPAAGPEPRPHAPSSPDQSSKRPPVTGDPEKHEAARRLARLILSDVALYNQKAVEDGIRNNTFRQLLKDELEEGRKLYRSRVSSDIVVVTDYFEQAIEDFIQKRKGKK
jgi:DNA-binding response OmpR family regulator